MSIFDPHFCPRCGTELRPDQFDGKIRGYCPACDVHVFHVPCPSAGVAVVDGRRVLLIERGTHPHRGTWALPGGVIEHGESPREAAVRELAEETNVTVDPSALVSSTIWKGPEADDHFDVTTVIVTFAVARVDTDGEPTAGTDEHAARFWTLEEIREDLRLGEAERIQRAIRVLER